MGNRFLLIVKKFRNDSLFFYGVIKKIWSRVKMTLPLSK